MRRSLVDLMTAVAILGFGNEVFPRREPVVTQDLQLDKPSKYALEKIAKAEAKRQRKAALRAKESL